MNKFISKIISAAICVGIVVGNASSVCAADVNITPKYEMHGNKCGKAIVSPEIDRDVYVTITQITPDGNYLYYDTKISADKANGGNNYIFNLEGRVDSSYMIVISVPKYKTSDTNQMFTHQFKVEDTDFITNDVINGYLFNFKLDGSTNIDKPKVINTTNPKKNADNIVETTKTLSFPIANFLRGDANLNGDIEILDATSIAKHLLTKNYLKGDSLTAADYDENGKVDILDATGIAQYLLKKNKK